MEGVVAGRGAERTFPWELLANETARWIWGIICCLVLFFRILVEKEGRGEFRWGNEAEASPKLLTTLWRGFRLYSTGIMESVWRFE